MDKPKKRILITGTTGLVGYRIYEYLKSSTDWEITGTSRSDGKYVDYLANLTELNSVNKLKKNIPVDVIIHAAAISKTDECESKRDVCYAVNVVSSKNLLKTFNTAKFVFFSTYAVYNRPEGKCEETAPVGSVNYYVETKLLGEDLFKKSPGSLIFRPSVIFGFTPFTRYSKNYFMQLIDNIRNKQIMQSPIDQYFNPVHVDIVSEITKKSIEQNLKGVYNIGSNEEISKYLFNRKIMQRFDFDEQYLKGIDSQSLAVSRPMNGTISSRRIQETLGYRIPALDEMIDMMYHSTPRNLLQDLMINN